jgi:alpha-ketoglutarate-dependent taurine dioxygenase
MKISKIPGLGSYGHYIDGIDFKNLSHEEWMEIGQLHMKGLVTILRDVTLTIEEYRYWMLKFGPFKSNYKRTMKVLYGKEFNELTPDMVDESQHPFHKHLITHGDVLLEEAPVMPVRYDSELEWHSNESGTLTFTPGISLLGDKHTVGSSTGFVQTVDWYEKQTESFRSELDEMIVIHNFTPGGFTKIELQSEMLRDIMQIGFCPFDGSEIPLVMKSPGGIKGMHYPINTVSGIKGMSQQDSDKLFAKINKELFTDEYVFDHWYQQDNDLLLFDNSLTMHRRLGGDGTRLVHRIQFDYSNLLDSPWLPYYQPEYLELYKQQVREVVERLGVSDFKLPD